MSDAPESFDYGVKARIDQNAVNYSQAATSTYYASSVAPSGQADDKQSVYTYSSMDAQQFIKRIGNRAYNNLSDVYFLPTDDDEWTRLNKQHIAIRVGVGALYPVPDVVRSILAPQEGETKRILDLGCGTGLWSCEMAKEFPHCEVLGVDLAPVPIDKMDVPSNCKYEIDDINMGLGHFLGQYDLVNARLIGAGLKDFRKTMQAASECLKPGGMVIWLDGDYDMYAEDRHVYMPFATDEDPNGSWFQRIVYEMRRGAVNSGRSDIHGMAKELDAGLWEEPLMDPATCSTASLYLPIGPWPTEIKSVTQSQVVGYVGSIMRQDLMSVHRAGHAVVKRSGYTEETLLEWSRKADEEMMSMTKPMWFRMRLAWGRRRAAEGSPALTVPPAAADSSTASAYPYYYIHATREESLREAALRNRNKDLPEPPLPVVQK